MTNFINNGILLYQLDFEHFFTHLFADIKVIYLIMDLHQLSLAQCSHIKVCYNWQERLEKPDWQTAV